MTDTIITEKNAQMIELKLERYPDANCMECPLLAQKPVDGYVENDDLDDIQAVYIAEHPGQEEVRKGIPLCGETGQVLELGVRAVKGDWSRSYRTNAVLCMPPYGSKLDKQAVDCCRPRLKRELGELSRRNPDVTIVAMGNHAAKSIHDIAGKKTTAKITTLRGTNIIVGPIGARVHFTWNAAYIYRERQKSPLFLEDLEKALFGMSLPYPKLAKQPPEVRHCVMPDDVFNAISNLNLAEGYIAYDIESTTAITFDQIRAASGELTAFGFSDSLDYCYVVSPEVMSIQEVQDAIHNLFTRSDVLTTAQNGKFDQLFLKEKLGLEIPLGFDTMLAHAVLDENDYHGLKDMSKRYLGVPDYDQEVNKYVYKRNKVAYYDEVPYDVLTDYLAYDVCCTLALQRIFLKELKQRDHYHEPFLFPVMAASDMLMRAEERGMTIDIEYFKSQVATVTVAIAELTLEMRRISGNMDLNPNSWVQVQPIMYDKFQFPKVSGKGFKAGSTSKPAIKKIKEVMQKRTGDPTWTHPFLESKLKYSRINKIATAYINPLQTWPHPDDHRVHTTFNLHIAVTGRLSSRDPALQVLPRPSDRWGRIIRAGFIAAPGMVLGKADHSQAELRTLAVESQDEYLLWCYNNGVDLHSAMGDLVVTATPKIDWTEEIIKPRSVAKVVNFGYAYDATPAGLASTFPDLITYPLAQRIHRDYDQQWEGAAAWKRRTKALAYQQGYIETVFGRRRRFPSISSDNRAEVGRQAVNMPIQSIASDLVLIAAIELDKLGVPIVLLVHDEIIFESPESEANDILKLCADVMLKVARDYSDDVIWQVDGSLRDRWAATDPELESTYPTQSWSSR